MNDNEMSLKLHEEHGGVDAFLICLDTKDMEEIIETVKRIAPGSGGFNLEDISAPRCFEIERRLKEELDIPVFHDDQHGTAIVVAAVLLNAMNLVGKKMEEINIVINGAGSAGISICKLLLKFGGATALYLLDKLGFYFFFFDVNTYPAHKIAATITSHIAISFTSIMRLQIQIFSTRQAGLD